MLHKIVNVISSVSEKSTDSAVSQLMFGYFVGLIDSNDLKHNRHENNPNQTLLQRYQPD